MCSLVLECRVDVNGAQQDGQQALGIIIYRFVLISRVRDWLWRVECLKIYKRFFLRSLCVRFSCERVTSVLRVMSFMGF